MFQSKVADEFIVSSATLDWNRGGFWFQRVMTKEVLLPTDSRNQEAMGGKHLVLFGFLIVSMSAKGTVKAAAGAV